MMRSMRIAIALLLVQRVTTALAWGQAAAEYGMAASKSTAAASSVRSIPSRTAGRLAGRVQRATSKVPVSVMQDNRKKLEEKGKEDGGKLHVESVPDKATVSINGAPVANTPADLSLPVGKHYVEVTSPGYVFWSTEIILKRGDTHSIKAELESQYKSSINLSLKKK